ncbi:N-acetyltransferase GCN5 [Cylindrobasidium torrendii FP15055 ss-10]|uniref:N-acetyltransferase GCN5 n=1 Tax=Cylindrobasidium torrendii FP15055 ss-10 TaxID=1314674 RepID=A0A0D7BQ80_9AGAR|nr:N-acetyltransferase GCN5 [Cylindrobasidium torrendii FP15055 ss-10]
MYAATTRPATPDDIPTILSFIIELAVYEKERDKALATPESMHKALFEDGHVANAFIAEADNKPVGFALYFYNFSTWIGKKGIYLEDLYVTPSARNLGVGKALFRALAKVAIEEDCGRIDWSVLKWNTPSIGFYESSLGAIRQEEWVGMRLEGAEAFERLKSLGA